MRKELEKLKDDLKEDGVAIPHLHWRLMRGACASYFESDLKSAQAQLRHAKPTITAEVYQRSLDSSIRAKVEEIDQMLGGTQAVPKQSRKSPSRPRAKAKK